MRAASRTTLCFLLMIIVLSSATFAATIEIPLSEFQGEYPLGGEPQIVSLHLPQMPSIIHSAAVRLTGTAAVGSCFDPEYGTVPWAMVFTAAMGDTLPVPYPAHYWTATIYLSGESGAFEWTAQFAPEPPTTTWGFLMDAEAKISLSGVPVGLIDQLPLTPPTAIVTDAVLLIDLEPVAAKATSWGRVKALYHVR